MAGVRILLVEGFEDARELSAAFLCDAGFEVAMVADGAEALVKARADLPDVIVLDLALPVVDGWEAIRALKADECTRHIPIVVMSGYRVDDYRERANDLGCAGFLRKPSPPAVLVAEIQRVLGR
jgi:CheY-like chemotaxis protein